jgi:hypothetical protein
VRSKSPLAMLAAATTVLVACAHDGRCTARLDAPQDRGTRAAVAAAGGRDVPQ